MKKSRLDVLLNESISSEEVKAASLVESHFPKVVERISHVTSPILNEEAMTGCLVERQVAEARRRKGLRRFLRGVNEGRCTHVPDRCF